MKNALSKSSENKNSPRQLSDCFCFLSFKMMMEQSLSSILFEAFFVPEYTRNCLDEFRKLLIITLIPSH